MKRNLIFVAVAVLTVLMVMGAAWKTDFQMLEDYNEGPFKVGGFTDHPITTAATQSYSLSSTGKADRVISTYSATGASTLHLMSNLVLSGRELVIIDGGGNSDPNNIVIDTEGSETVNGGATYTVATDYKQIRCLSDGTNWLCY